MRQQGLPDDFFRPFSREPSPVVCDGHLRKPGENQGSQEAEKGAGSRLKNGRSAVCDQANTEKVGKMGAGS